MLVRLSSPVRPDPSECAPPSGSSRGAFLAVQRCAQVAAHPSDQRMLVAQHPLAVGEGMFVQRDGAPQISGRLVGIGEIAAGGQGVGVILAQHPPTVGEGLLVQRDRAPQTSRVSPSAIWKSVIAATSACCAARLGFVRYNLTPLWPNRS